LNIDTNENKRRKFDEIYSPAGIAGFNYYGRLPGIDASQAGN
jgi:hypothetical protein